MSIPDWFFSFVSAAALVIIGWVLALLKGKLSRRDERREAVAALRFELESNLGWLDDILETHNYLRDEAWIILKNKGYISYLPKPIPVQVIKVYDQLHGLNRCIKILREMKQEPKETTANSNAEDQKEELGDSIRTLISLLDNHMPKIGRNFQKIA